MLIQTPAWFSVWRWLVRVSSLILLALLQAAAWSYQFLLARDTDFQEFQFERLVR
jgi:hypothetical protein